jgi:glucose-6-phosphate dehydrogenase assembly protein OpcA
MSAKSLIARLEDELRAIWTEPAEPGGAPLSRVCTMNLVVVAGASELAARYTPIVDEVTASTPARAIVASVEPERGGGSLEGSATAVCSLTGGKKVCSERIVLSATGEASVRVASAIEALLVPEIPTTLVWLGRVHVDDPVFEAVASEAARVIVDSEYTSLSSLLHLASWARRKPRGPRIADLAWARLGPWQELLARFFDGKDAAALAAKVTRLAVRQASDPGARLGPEPALLLGWVATRLGWKTSRLGGTLRFKRPDGETVTLELGAVPRPEGVAPSAMAMVGIEARDDEEGRSMRGTIERELASGLSTQEGTTPDADVIVWRQTADSGPAIEQRVRLGANKAAKWLERTLHRPANDPAFAESVAFAEQIVEDGLEAPLAEGRFTW